MIAFWQHLDEHRMLPIKLALAGAGVVVLAWAWLAPAHGRRVRDALLIGLGLASCAAWWNLFHFHYGPYSIHYAEFFHHYIGAKYEPELGYTRLYDCTVVAEAEYAHVGPRLAQLEIRDLRTNELVSAKHALAHPEACKDHFSAERWHAFLRDTDFFWQGASWDRWPVVLRDHGYNATPVWRLLASAFASRVDVLDDTSGFRLAMLDPILLVGAMVALWWAFGWRTLCVALIFFGTNYPARYWWTGGAFLREDWLCAAIAGICLMKRDRPLAAGIALGYGTLLRVYPGFLIAALAIKVAIASVRARRLAWTRAHRRFFAGAALVTAVLVPLSIPYGGSWRGFVANSEKHLATPLTNNMGWGVLVTYEHEPRDDVPTWIAHQREDRASRRLVLVAGIVAFLVLLGAAVARCDDWTALVLGIGLVFVVAQPTCYYLIVFMAFAALWPLVPWSGMALALASAASGLLALVVPDWNNDPYAAISLVYLVLVVALVAGVARSGSRPAADPDPSPST